LRRWHSHSLADQVVSSDAKFRNVRNAQISAAKHHASSSW